jgi:hypothetical protein
MSPLIDITSANINTWLRFNVAYAKYNSSSNDALQILASTDCGNTWTSIYNKSGTNLSTAPITTGVFTPNASQWRTDSVNLNSFAGQTELILNFTAISNYGNNLFVDDIFVGDISTGISEDKTEFSQGGIDYWVVKLEGAGNIQWQNTFGGSNVDELQFISLTTDGGYIIGGISVSNTSGDKTENCQGGYDYWVVKLTANFNLIEGKAFADLNSNNLNDTGEPTLQGIVVTESLTGSFGFSEQNGIYNVAVVDSGNFTVAPSILLHYSAVPASHNAYFPAMQLTDSLNVFAFQPTGVINDLVITITPTSPFRPGFNAHYNLHYRNVGTTSLTGTVIFYPDTEVTYVSSSVTPSFISADSIKWQTSLLNPFDDGDILLTVNVNQGTPIGA